MHIEINRTTVTLPRDGLLSIRDGAGTRIECRSGSLWVTQEGDVRDTVIGPADALTIRKPGLTVITALQSSSVMLIGPDIRNAGEARRLRPLDAEQVLCS